MNNDYLPRWHQVYNGKTYLIIVVPEEWAQLWASAFNYIQYENLEWVVRKGHWLVGCEPGLSYLAPRFEDVDPPCLS